METEMMRCGKAARGLGQLKDAARHLDEMGVIDCSQDQIVRASLDALSEGLKSESWDNVAIAAEALARMANYYPWRERPWFMDGPRK